MIILTPTKKTNSYIMQTFQLHSTSGTARGRPPLQPCGSSLCTSSSMCTSSSLCTSSSHGCHQHTLCSNSPYTRQYLGQADRHLDCSPTDLALPHPSGQGFVFSCSPLETGYSPELARAWPVVDTSRPPPPLLHLPTL